jgi:enoyl-CoA hydratase/carnithine racemase
VIASEEATFFDSHVSYGFASVFEAIGMSMFVPPREVLRWMLLDLEERMSSQRALQIGLVSEIVARENLMPHAHELAAIIAAKPPYGVQGSVKAFWDAIWQKFSDVDRWGIRYNDASSRPSDGSIQASSMEVALTTSRWWPSILLHMNRTSYERA